MSERETKEGVGVGVEKLLTRVPQSTEGTFVIPEGTTTICDQAFFNCQITSVVIPGTVTSIGRKAFYGCEHLKTITVPKSVTVIDPEAFAQCSSLKAVTLEGDSIAIGSSAFYCCHKLTKITIVGATQIGCEAFANCESLKKITIPEGVTVVETNTFKGCSGLKSVSFPNSLERIDYNAFKGCSSLAAINIPKNVSSIYCAAFSGCNSLEKITVDKYNETYHSKNNCLIDSANRKLIVGCKNSQIPSNGSVTCIGKYAFRDCGALAYINIPSCITQIEDLAFSGCLGLKDLFIPASVIKMGKEIAVECVPTFTFYCEKEPADTWDSKWNKVNPRAIRSTADTRQHVPRWWYGKFVI